MFDFIFGCFKGGLKHLFGERVGFFCFEYQVKMIVHYAPLLDTYSIAKHQRPSRTVVDIIPTGKNTIFFKKL